MASSASLDGAWPLIGLALALLLVPVLGGEYRAYQIGVYLLHGLAAQGVALAWGRAGFLPLGQALFFGAAAYASALILKAAAAQPAWLLAWPLALLGPALAAYAMARLLFARRSESGPFFSLITLALAMLGFQVANQWSSVTGGFNGLGEVPDLPGLDRYGSLYWLIAAVTLLATGATAWLNRTPLGTLWAALAQNEGRLQFFGFATDRLKALAFAISALLAALAGALYAPHQGLVTPQAGSVMLSAEMVVWAAVGGRHSPYGALLGAVGVGILSAELRDRFMLWEGIVALVFIVVVLKFPGGMWSAVEGAAALVGERWRRLARRGGARGRPAVDAAPEPDLAAPDARPAQLGPQSGDDAAPALQFRDVRVRAHGVHILDGLGFDIRGRGIHCVIGPNGAGKTSTFNALTGRLPIAEGEVLLFGQRIRRFHPVALARLGVGRKFQLPSVFPALTVAQNVAIACWAGRCRAADLLRPALLRWRTPLLPMLEQAFPFLATQRQRLAGELSQGERQMLELALAALPEPRLLLLDEPCAGLSPDETRRQIDTIVLIVAQLQATALVIEHDLSAVEQMGGQVHVLHQGRLLASGNLAGIQASAAVQAVYAGGRK
jgi:branched-chain amino acid transport system permease protein